MFLLFKNLVPFFYRRNSEHGICRCENDGTWQTATVGNVISYSNKIHQVNSFFLGSTDWHD